MSCLLLRYLAFMLCSTPLQQSVANVARHDPVVGTRPTWQALCGRLLTAHIRHGKRLCSR